MDILNLNTLKSVTARGGYFPCDVASQPGTPLGSCYVSRVDSGPESAGQYVDMTVEVNTFDAGKKQLFDDHVDSSSTFPVVDGGRGNTMSFGDAVSQLMLQTTAESTLTAPAKPRHKVQIWISTLLENKKFEAFIIGIILANFVSLSLFRPHEPENSPWNSHLSWVELTFNVIYTLELALRLAVCSTFLDFFKGPWNIFDLFIVLSGYASRVCSAFPACQSIEGFASLRILRTLRPLRSVSRIPALRQIVDGLLNSVPLLLSSLGIFVIYLVMFAIAGLHLFNDGLANRCVAYFPDHDNHHEGLESTSALPTENQIFGCGSGRSCNGEEECLSGGALVESGHLELPRSVPGFDNFPQAFLSVLVITTPSNWIFPMYRAADAFGPSYILYFVTLVLTGPNFIVYLFVAVLKVNFRNGAKKRKKATLKKQKASIDIKPKTSAPINKFRVAAQTVMFANMMMHVAESSHNSLEMTSNSHSRGSSFVNIAKRTQKMSLRLINSPRFDQFFGFVIAFNTLLLALEHHNMNTDLFKVLEMVNLVLTVLFVLEVVLKTLGVGPRAYFRSYFNCFDFAIVLASIAEFLLASGYGLAALRSFRVFRVLKVFNYVPVLKSIVAVLFSSLASFLSICLLLFVLLSVCAVMGMHRYGVVVPSTERPNTSNVGQSFLMFFQTLTMSDWSVPMMDLVRRSGWSAVAMFVPVVLIGNLVILNLFLATVMENFEVIFRNMEEQKFEAERRQWLQQNGTGEGNVAADSYISNDRVSQTSGRTRKQSRLRIPSSIGKITPTRGALGRKDSPFRIKPVLRKSVSMPFLSSKSTKLKSSGRNDRVFRFPSDRSTGDLGKKSSFKNSSPFQQQPLRRSVSLHTPRTAFPVTPTRSRNLAHELLLSKASRLFGSAPANVSQMSRQGSPTLSSSERGSPRSPRTVESPKKPVLKSILRKSLSCSQLEFKSIMENVTLQVPDAPLSPVLEFEIASNHELQQVGRKEITSQNTERARESSASSSNVASQHTAVVKASNIVPSRVQDTYKHAKCTMRNKARSVPNIINHISGLSLDQMLENSKDTSRNFGNVRSRNSPDDSLDGSSNSSAGNEQCAGNEQDPGSNTKEVEMTELASSSNLVTFPAHPHTHDDSCSVVSSCHLRIKTSSDDYTPNWSIHTKTNPNGTSAQLTNACPPSRSQASGSNMDPGPITFKLLQTQMIDDQSVVPKTPEFVRDDFLDKDKFLQSSSSLFDVPGTSHHSLPGIDLAATTITVQESSSSTLLRTPCHSSHSLEDEERFDPTPSMSSGPRPSMESIETCQSIPERSTFPFLTSPFSRRSSDDSSYPLDDDGLSANNPFLKFTNTLFVEGDDDSFLRQEKVKPVRPNMIQLVACPPRPEGYSEGSPASLPPTPKHLFFCDEVFCTEIERVTRAGRVKKLSSDTQAGRAFAKSKRYRGKSTRATLLDSSSSRGVVEIHDSEPYQCDLPSEDDSSSEDETMDDNSVRRESSLFANFEPLFNHAGFYGLRPKLRWVLGQRFETVMFVCVLVSCCSMAVDSPLGNGENVVLEVAHMADIITTGIFTIEILLKTYMLGLFGQIGYLSSNWNRLDLVIVVSSLMFLLFDSWEVIRLDFALLRMLRVLRALRVISRSPSIQVVVNLLVESFFSIANVFAVLLIFFFIFGVLGVQLYSGKMYHCAVRRHDLFDHDHSHDLDLEQEVLSQILSLDRSECERTEGLKWVNPPNHFDNIGAAGLSLFALSTLDGWVAIMHNAMDSTTVDSAPRMNANPGGALYCIAFICCVAFGFMNLFIGVVHFQFVKMKLLHETNDSSLNKMQNQWRRTVEVLAGLPPPVVHFLPMGKSLLSRTRRLAFRITQTDTFERVMMVLIITNTVTMMSLHNGQPEWWDQILEYCENGFLLVFTLEAVLKLLALGMLFFSDWWNRFDLAVVALSMLEIFFSMTVNTSFLRIFRVARIVRVTRLLRLTKTLSNLRALLHTLLASLSGFGSVFALLALSFFMYAYLGVQLFGRVKLRTTQDPVIGMNEHVNFDTFWNACLALLQVATKDNWVSLMNDCRKGECRVDAPGAGACGGQAAAILFFTSFVIGVGFVLLQLVAAVVIQNFEELQEKNKWPVKSEDLEEFCTLWAHVVHDNTMTSKDLVRLMNKSPTPLGVLNPSWKRSRPPLGFRHGANVIKFLSKCKHTFDGDQQLGYHSVLLDLATCVAGRNLPEGKILDQNAVLIDKILKKDQVVLTKKKLELLPSFQQKVTSSFKRRSLDPTDTPFNPVTLPEAYAILVIQRHWRDFQRQIHEKDVSHSSSRLRRSQETTPTKRNLLLKKIKAAMPFI